MASAITLEGIDQALSNLKYKNKNTLKSRFVRHIRKYYTVESALVSLNEIDHEELIKILWDTDHTFEAVKNKRKNLNSVRSSVNADLKKLYEKGENPEGIKIGTNNIFVMSEDAKDKILKDFGYELQQDGTVKLDQIMDILKLANETVSGSMAVEDTATKDGINKIDRLKNLIKGLSEKVGLGSTDLSKTASGDGDTAGKGDEKGAGFEETTEVFDERTLNEFDEVEEITDLDDDVAYIDDADTEEILDDPEDIEVDEISEADTEDLAEAAEIEEEFEEVLDEEDTETEDVEDVEEIIAGDISEEQSGGAGSGDEEIRDAIGLGQDPGQGKSEEGSGGPEPSVSDVGARLEAGKPGDGVGAVGDTADKGDGKGFGSMGAAEILEDSESDTMDAVEDMEDLEEVVEEDILDDSEDIEVDEISEADTEDLVEAGNLTDKTERKFEGEGGNRENEQLGLPVGSLEQEYSVESDSKIKKNKLLAEEFDGYLGSMDRYYNQYILIPGGEYTIGSKHPKRDEKPEQTVYLEPFYFGRFPITNGLFEIFVEKTGYKTTAEKIGYGTVYYGRIQKKKDELTGLITSIWNSSLYSQTVKGACWYQPSGPKSTIYNKKNHPVVQISVEDAMAFAAWTGKRLPTENEWEAASRTANGWIFPWGQEWKQETCNIEDSCTADTTSVDKYVEFENDFGIVDTLGNVLEWTDTRFETKSRTNNGEKYSVVKGGSWISGNDIKLFSRFMMESESHSNILGFRCVAY